MTFGQFFLGFVTIAVATLAYRWQKTVDRESAALAELRIMLSSYAVLSMRLFLKQPYKDQKYEERELDTFYNMSDEEIELYTLRDQIYVSAPQTVVDAVLDCDHKFRNWKITFPPIGVQSDEANEKNNSAATDFKFSHERMLLVMRQEFAAHNKMPLPGFLNKMQNKLFKNN